MNFGQLTIGMGMSDEDSIYTAQPILGEPLDCSCLEALATVYENSTDDVRSDLCHGRRIV